MLQTLKSMATRYNDYMTYVARKRACEVLLRSSDRMLEDAGFSRELLEKGAAAWPWQATDPNEVLQAVSYNKLPINSAVNEPELHNTHDLSTPVITHGTTTELENNDCEVTEQQQERKVA